MFGWSCQQTNCETCNSNHPNVFPTTSIISYQLTRFMEDVGKAHFCPDQGAGSAVCHMNNFTKCVLTLLSSCIIQKWSFRPISLVNLHDIFSHFQNLSMFTALLALLWSTYIKLGRAIENGSNTQGFLFAIAASLIIGKTWCSSRNQSKQQDAIDKQIDGLGTCLTELNSRVDTLIERWEEELSQERQR